MATSVASGASDSTRDCKARPKHMMAMPQNRLRVAKYASLPLSGNSSARHTASTDTATIRKRCGLWRCSTLNSSEPMIPAPPNNSRMRVTTLPLNPATV